MHIRAAALYLAHDHTIHATTVVGVRGYRRGSGTARYFLSPSPSFLPVGSSGLGPSSDDIAACTARTRQPHKHAHNTACTRRAPLRSHRGATPWRSPGQASTFSLDQGYVPNGFLTHTWILGSLMSTFPRLLSRLSTQRGSLNSGTDGTNNHTQWERAPRLPRLFGALTPPITLATPRHHPHCQHTAYLRQHLHPRQGRVRLAWQPLAGSRALQRARRQSRWRPRWRSPCRLERQQQEQESPSLSEPVSPAQTHPDVR